jgi:hypothetical protein
MDAARYEARELGHSRLGTGHLLLGLIREGDNIATVILGSFAIQAKDRPQMDPGVLDRGILREERSRLMLTT